MSNSILLEVAISMVFAILLLSLIVSSITEIWTLLRKKRGKFLKKALIEILNDKQNKNWAELIYEHPLVDGLKRSERKLPSYISSKTFSMCLVDIISREGYDITFTKEEDGSTTFTEIKDSDTFKAFCTGIDALKESDVKRILSVFRENSTDLITLNSKIENWYNEYMDRVGGWFKKDIKKRVIFISLGVAIFFNVDAIHLFNSLWKNANIRGTIVSAAENYVNKKDTVSNKTMNTAQMDSVFTEIEKAYQNLEVLNLPIGWHCTKKERMVKGVTYCSCITHQIKTDWKWKILGWFITAFLISFGAPFWFDLLNKLVAFRSSGKKPK